MVTYMRLLTVGIALLSAFSCFADTVTMKDGRVVRGAYLGGSARQVRMEVGDQIQTLDVTDIDRIEFGGAPAPPPPPPRAASRPVLRRDDNVMRPDNAPIPAQQMSSSADLPAGTNLVVRLIDAVDSETANPGQTFAASLDQPVLVNGQTVIPRGANVVLKLVDEKQSGTFT